MIRLVIGHGNIVKDAVILDAPGTPAHCARAAAEVLTSVLGGHQPAARRGPVAVRWTRSLDARRSGLEYGLHVTTATWP
jgi:hypothetical protein